MPEHILDFFHGLVFHLGTGNVHMSAAAHMLHDDLHVHFINGSCTDINLSLILREDKLAAERLAEAKALEQKLEGLKIEVTMKAGENGKVFGSVASKEIAEQAKKQHGLELDKKKIVLAEPIKSFGMHEVGIKLHPEVTGKLYVLVKEA